MQNSTNNTATLNNEVVNSQNSVANATPSAAKTQRVFETQADWLRLESMTLSLLVALTKGFALHEDAIKGFAFGYTTDKNGKAVKCPTKGKDSQGHEVTLNVMQTQPHAKNYVLCLALGYASPKATKYLKGTCLEKIDRLAIAKTICQVVYPKGNVEKRLFGTDGVTPKRGKWIAEQVLNAINGEAVSPTTEASEQSKATTNVVEPKSDAKVTTKGGKKAKSSKSAK